MRKINNRHVSSPCRVMLPFRWFAILLVLWISCEGKSDRVLLRDINTLTFVRDQYTNSRRTGPVPQLKCIGGSARHDRSYHPSTAQCYNRGFDGQDVQWECKAALSKKVFLGRVRVNCEGYQHPDDPYVLAGSCGLEYELEYSDERKHHKSHLHDLFGSPDHVKYASMFGLLILAALIWYCCLSGTRDLGATEPVGFRAEGPSAPYPDEQPPNYEEAMRDSTPPNDDETWTRRRHQQSAARPPSYGWADLPTDSSSSSSSRYRYQHRGPGSNYYCKQEGDAPCESGSGSWLSHGLSAGAGFLGGYLFGSSRTAPDPTVPRESRTHTRLYPDLSAWADEPRRHSSNGDHDSDHHVSTSFGGTTRR